MARLDRNMPDRIALHVGMHKTGTTAIQGALSTLGNGPNWEYLCFKHPNASNLIRQAYAGQPRPDNGIPQPSFASDASEARNLISRRMQATTADIAIISGEELSRLPAEAWRQLGAACINDMPGNGRIEAFVYIRAPLSFLQAAFQQRLRKNFVPFGQIINPGQIDYVVRFAQLERSLSPECISYKPYLVDEFRDASVVSDFADWLEIEIPDSSAANVRDNQALSSEAVKLLYIWRQKYPHIKPDDGKLIRALSLLQGPRLHFSESALTPIRAVLARQYAWSEVRMGWDMAEPLLPDRPHSIRAESDLVSVTPATLSWLGEMTGLSMSRLGNTPDELVEVLDRIITAPWRRSFLQRAKRLIGRG